MVKYDGPLVDEENPCYCPGLPAIVYLERLRERLDKLTFSQDDLYASSFASLLYKTANEEGLVSLCHARQDGLETLNDDSSTLGSIYSVHGFERGNSSSNSSQRFRSALDKYPSVSDARALSGLSMKRKRQAFSDAFCDLDGPVKRGRSSQSVNESSFDLSGKADPLLISPRTFGSSNTREFSERKDTVVEDKSAKRLVSKIQALQESPRDIRALISRLESLLPGLRLKERLQALQNLTHQKIADFLALNGLLNPQVVDLLRTSHVWRLDLTDSALDEAGLNLAGRELLRAFDKPNSFASLSVISLNNTPVEDIDLIYIHHLPKLATLMLDNTMIGNEAIFHLASLRRSLTDLHIRMNPGIDDDAVPALLLLTNLRFLSLHGTGVGIDGLRRLARTIYDEDRMVDVEIPFACEDYIDNMHSKYKIDPRPPHITDPSVCAHLSVNALRRNLTEHAAYNPTIVASGTKPEMEERLRRILETRQLDLLVRSMVWGDGDDASIKEDNCEK